jgi:hypothetical protein
MAQVSGQSCGQAARTSVRAAGSAMAICMSYRVCRSAARIVQPRTSRALGRSTAGLGRLRAMAVTGT